MAEINAMNSHIHFRRNILETQNKTYLSSCRYNSSDIYDRLCPIFEIKTILKETGTEFEAIGVVVCITLKVPSFLTEHNLS